MEENRYNQLKEYLTISILPNDRKLANQIQRQSKHFMILENQLFKKDKKNKGNFLKVLKIHEIETVLYATHNHPTGRHLGIEKVFEKIRETIIGRKCSKTLGTILKDVTLVKEEGSPQRKRYYILYQLENLLRNWNRFRRTFTAHEKWKQIHNRSN